MTLIVCVMCSTPAWLFTASEALRPVDGASAPRRVTSLNVMALSGIDERQIGLTNGSMTSKGDRNTFS